MEVKRDVGIAKKMIVKVVTLELCLIVVLIMSCIAISDGTNALAFGVDMILAAIIANALLLVHYVKAYKSAKIRLNEGEL